MNARRRPSLVEQVRESLLAELSSGKLPPGSKLPNETELAERFTVSRSTIREAVGSLTDAGYLSRRHGSGTFVTALPRTLHPLETTVSYTGMIRASGHQPSETVVSKEVRDPSQTEREVLGLAADESVIEIERVRLADRRPVIYSRDRIPVALLGEASEQTLDSSLYELLAAAGHPVASASAQITPTVADARLARLLEVKRGTPLLRIDQVDYDERGRTVMLSAEWHVADVFDLIVNRRASPSSD
jgi:DNA-binding GntR family transcriptional regulator